MATRRAMIRFRSTVAAQAKLEEAKPFHEMPGPQGLPLVGNSWRFLPFIGNLRTQDFWHLQKHLRSIYGDIVRLDGQFGQPPWVLVMNPEFVEQVYRKEGPYPVRHSFPSLDYYTSVTRKDWFQGIKGTIVSQGEEWRNFRSKVNPHLMQPRAIKKYVPIMDQMASDFIDRMEELKDEKGEMPEDFLNEIYKWALESVALVSLDTRLGCLSGNLPPDSEPQQMIQMVKTLFASIETLDMKVSLWRLISTPSWRLYVSTLDTFYVLAMKYIDAAMQKVKTKVNDGSTDLSVLEKILIDNDDPRYAVAMAFDILFAGIDTTSRTAAFVFYFLAKHQDKQEKLFEELKTILPESPNEPLTDKKLEQMKYLKGCVKEALRLRPASSISLRNVHTDDYVLAGYKVPKDTVLFLCLMTMSNSEDQFPRSSEFSPERWLKTVPGQPSEAQKAHPFSYLPFGFGPRSCVGKRYSEQQVETLVAKESLMARVGKSLSLHTMQTFYELQQNNLLCDAVIRLEDGSSYPVHRAIMSACSDYFRTMFTTTLNSREKTDVILPDVKAESMNYVIRYAYLRDADIRADNVCRLLVTADYLSITGMMELCCDFLRRALAPANCLGIMLFARSHFCRDLAEDARVYTLRNFTQVVADSDELLHLAVDELKLLISCDELNVKSEETAWEGVIRWVDHEPVGRRQHVVTLMSAIRLGLLDTQYFLEKVKDHPYVAGNEDCRPLIIETLKFLYDLEMITEKDGEVPTPDIALPRVPHEILFAIGGWSGGSPTNYIETYDTRADRWVKVDEVDPAGAIAYHGTAVIGFNIYVIGGFDGMYYFNSCRCFNAVTKRWWEVAPMHGRRCYVSVAVLDELIYAMGGYDGHHRQFSVERYDHRSNQWSLIASMNVQRSDASAATLNDRIYIAGGFNGQECMNSAEVYDPEVNQWTMIVPMRSRRSGVSCVSYRGCIYVIGGFNGVSRMSSGEKYNPGTNTWTPIPEMYSPRSNFAIEVIDDMIFAMGGFNGVTTIYHVECYDQRTNEWYEATDMNVYRSALSACVITGLPNVHDYIHKHRERLVEEKRQKLLAVRNAQVQTETSSGGGGGGGGNEDDEEEDDNDMVTDAMDSDYNVPVLAFYSGGAAQFNSDQDSDTDDDAVADPAEYSEDDDAGPSTSN